MATTRTALVGYPNRYLVQALFLASGSMPAAIRSALMIVACAGAIVALPRAAQISGCPEPTRSLGTQCVLDADVVLGDDPVDLASFTTLNCRGHALYARTPGVDDDPTTPANEYQPSIPEIGVLVHEAEGVKMLNCTLVGFDFGAVVAKAKGVEKPTKLLSNAIHARNTGILVVGADDVLLADNTVTYSSRTGRGISLIRDSDRNLVTNNRITGPADPPGTTAGFFRVIPGEPRPVGACTNCGMITEDPPGTSLFNLRAGDVFLQFPNEPGSRNDDNVFESNVVVLPGPSGSGINASVRSSRPVLRGNFVQGGFDGISGAGFPANTLASFPGTCSLDQGTFCRDLSDCDDGIKGTCDNAYTQRIDGRVWDARYENNTLEGPFTNAGINIAASQLRPFLEGNTIFDTGNGAGLSVAGFAMETLIARRNVITNAAVGLSLTRGTADSFGAFSLNDLGGNTIRIRLIGSFAAPFAAELSENGLGNWWGRTCAEGGFIDDDSPSPATVRDSHPFGTPVARSTAQIEPCF